MIEIVLRGVEAFDDIKQFEKRIPIAAQRAVNRVLNQARTRSGRDIREQIAFPARYLVGAEGKIDLIPATKSSLSGKLTASSRARSLARFVTSSSKKLGVKVRVDPGAIKGLPGAFIIGIGDRSLLAVRSPGEPRGAYKPRLIAPGLWSLYGPSVSQALLNAKGGGIWPEMVPFLSDLLETEFLRQMKLEN